MRVRIKTNSDYEFNKTQDLLQLFGYVWLSRYYSTGGYKTNSRYAHYRYRQITVYTSGDYVGAITADTEYDEVVNSVDKTKGE